MYIPIHPTTTTTRSLQMRQPTVHADGFRDVSRAPAVWTDMTKAHGFVDITYKVHINQSITRPLLAVSFVVGSKTSI